MLLSTTMFIQTRMMTNSHKGHKKLELKQIFYIVHFPFLPMFSTKLSILFSCAFSAKRNSKVGDRLASAGTKSVLYNLVILDVIMHNGDAQLPCNYRCSQLIIDIIYRPTYRHFVPLHRRVSYAIGNSLK